MRVLIQLMVLVYHLPLLVKSTSFKMDFLSSGTVRTDPLTFSQIGNCLSDHVHRFYGAVSPRTMRPDVSYQDLRSASGNTGNVEENKSLYWNPAIYQGSIHVLIRHLWSISISQKGFSDSYFKFHALGQSSGHYKTLLNIIPSWIKDPPKDFCAWETIFLYENKEKNLKNKYK